MNRAKESPHWYIKFKKDGKIEVDKIVSPYGGFVSREAIEKYAEKNYENIMSITKTKPKEEIQQKQESRKGEANMLDPKNLKNGEEQYEEYFSDTSKKNLVQYDYRDKGR